MAIGEGPWEVADGPETDHLDAVSGLRDPRQPRPELAEASPHSRIDRREDGEGGSPIPGAEGPSPEELPDEADGHETQQDAADEAADDTAQEGSEEEVSEEEKHS